MSTKPRLHICVDARMILSSGIGVVLENYLIFLINSNEFKITLLGNPKILQTKTSLGNNYQVVEVDYPIYSFKELFLLSFKIPSCDVYWSPHFNLPLFKIKAHKVITTIHDTAHLSIGKELNINFIKRFYIYLRMLIAVRTSTIITTVSNFSKDEIIRFFPSSASKMQVIYNGVDRNVFKPKENQNPKIAYSTANKYPKEYLLFVGNVKSNKNLINLVKAFEQISNNFPSLHLIIVGKKEGFISVDSNLSQFIDSRDKKNTKIIFTGYVEEDELASIYSNAQILVFPSFYEGFGFPPLEAMASGCAVAAANAASIPEVCEDNVLYFDPFEVLSISSAISELMLNSDLKNKLIQKGLIHVLKFDWKNSAALFYQLLIAHPFGKN